MRRVSWSDALAFRRGSRRLHAESSSNFRRVKGLSGDDEFDTWPQLARVSLDDGVLHLQALRFYFAADSRVVAARLMASVRTVIWDWALAVSLASRASFID